MWILLQCWLWNRISFARCKHESLSSDCLKQLGKLEEANPKTSFLPQIGPSKDHFIFSTITLNCTNSKIPYLSSYMADSCGNILYCPINNIVLGNSKSILGLLFVVAKIENLILVLDLFMLINASSHYLRFMRKWTWSQ